MIQTLKKVGLIQSYLFFKFQNLKWYQVILIIQILGCRLIGQMRQKETEQFCKNFNSWMIKLTKTPILPNCQVPNGFFLYNWNCIIQKLKFCKIDQLFLCVSFFGERTYERIERISFSQNPNLSYIQLGYVGSFGPQQQLLYGTGPSFLWCSQQKAKTKAENGLSSGM